jgi:alpha-glucosidase
MLAAVDVRVVAAPLEEGVHAPATEWWREAVIYQVYTRSFADATGDGVGDLAGVRDRLPYLRDLGIDGLWFNPWYPSPGADNGYDISDYRSIDPDFGTLPEAEGLIADARALGIRTIVDVVPNHVSDQHPWFRAALASTPGSPERARFWFRPGRGTNGDEPPNQWQSIFGGDAWTRVADGEWYLHLFAPEQPDLNWTHPDVSAEFESVLRFWFDRGAAGVRIDSAALLMKDPELRDERPDAGPGEHPFSDRDETHDVYRRWRAIADSYDEPRVLVGEIWLPDRDRLARYLRPDELHTAFNFDFLGCPWEARRLRASIDASLAVHEPVGAPPTWVLSNHDVTRPVTRYGRADSSFAFATKRPGIPTDLERGTRRARAAALLTMALPGSMYVYQGEELGLPEVEDIPSERRRDPMWLRSGGADPGRDGCRVPMPWSGAGPPYGFSPEGAGRPWLDQPDDWTSLTVEAQTDDPASMLLLYREGLRIRRSRPWGAGPFRWLGALGTFFGVASLSFARGDAFACVVNFGPEPVALPAGAVVLIASNELEGGALPQDTTVWLYQENGGVDRSNWESTSAS